LVLGIEKIAKEGELKPGAELFVFTDNSTSERAFDKGTSKSRTLHALVVRLRKLQMEGQLFINFVWISGNQMINQGTDSLSRGDLTSGVMQGDAFLKHIPLREAVGKRHDLFLRWLKEALPGEEWRHLEPKDWFGKAFEEEQGKFIWTPPPAIADVALEQLCEVRHIHPHASHVFVCPTLITGRWKKQLLKISDAMFTLKAGTPLWPQEMLEPVTVCLISPLLSSSPWTMHRTEWLVERQDFMQEMLRSNSKAGRDCLREFWHESWNRSGGV
jgi:hypothetical protein